MPVLIKQVWFSNCYSQLVDSSNILYTPPVTIKYDNRTIEKTVIAEGWWNHVGFFIFKLGTSNTEKGMLYKTSICEAL